MPPSLQPRNRILRHFLIHEAAKLGEDTALAGLPLDSFRHDTADEREAYEREWKRTRVLLTQTAPPRRSLWRFFFPWCEDKE